MITVRLFSCCCILVLVCGGCSRERHTRGEAADVGAKVVDARSVAAAMRAHDARIESIEVEYVMDVGVGVEGNGAPLPRTGGTWAARGERQSLTEGEPGQPPRVRTATDGKTTRQLTLANPNRPEASIAPAERAPLGSANHLPRGASARFVWEQDLLAALEAGRLTVAPAAVIYDGARCYEVSGKVFASPQSPLFRALLDADRGCMPRYLEEYVSGPDGQPTSRNIMDRYELTEVKPGIWQPTRFRQQSLVRDPQGAWTVATVNVVRYPKVRVNEELPDGRFVVHFPKGTRVTEFDPAKPGAPPTVRTVEADEPADGARR